jgi:heme/copper-type cytochrome/quinol oxidase subunit 2
MGRNEIRLRRHRMSSGRIAQHRNYGQVMAAHEREQKLRRIFRVMIYLIIIFFLIVLFIMVTRWQERTAPEGHEPVKTTDYRSPITLIIRDLHTEPRINGSEAVVS